MGNKIESNVPSNVDKQISNQNSDDLKNWLRSVQSWTKMLNSPVDETLLKKQQNADGLYLPISHMEAELDRLFFGLWNTVNYSWQVVLNEIVGDIQVSVFHPIAKMWITRTGSAAIKIMTDKVPKRLEFKTDEKQDIKMERNNWARDVSNKKAGALSDLGGAARLKAMCFRNACLSFGKSMGRDVNRDSAGEYNPLIKSDSEELRLKLRKYLSKIVGECQIPETVETIKQNVLDAEKNNSATTEFFLELIHILEPDYDYSKED